MRSVMRRGLLLAVILSALLLSVACADDFSYHGIEAEWNYSQAMETLLLPVYEYDNQDKAHDRGVRVLRDVQTADWTMETYLMSDTLGSKGGLHGGLTVYKDAKNYLIFGLNSGKKMTLYGLCNGEEIGGGSVMAAHRYLRIEKKDGRYTFLSSEDGITWVSFTKDFQDITGALEGAQIGIMNRWTFFIEVFQTSGSGQKCWLAEYAYFRLNGRDMAFSLNGGNGWTYYKSKGVFAMAVSAGTSTTLLCRQKAEDWIIEGAPNYTSGADSTLTGITVYKDENNYLLLGVRGAFSNKTHYEVSGVMDGQPTGVLMAYDGFATTNRVLRVIRRTELGQPDRYYFYLSPGASCTTGVGLYLGCYEDAKGVFRGGYYGLMAVEESGNKDARFAAHYQFFTETNPVGYTDRFSQQTLDGPWHCQDVSGLMVEGALSFSSGEEPAYVLRAPLKRDWSLECTVNHIAVDSFAGLAMVQGENSLKYGVLNGRLVTRVTIAGQTEELAADAAAPYLRLIKDGCEYIMRYSLDGLIWLEAYRWVDTQEAFAGAHYGLGVQGGACSFGRFYEGYRPASAIENIEFVHQITGEAGINQTQSRWGFGSGDLGSLFELNGKVYMAFGDSNTSDNHVGSWIKNVLAVGTVNTPADGIRYTQMYNGLVNSGAEYGGAMIPSCGVGLEQDGGEKLYIWFHEIYAWNVGDHRDIAGAGWAVSDDGGESWVYERLFDGNTHFQYVTCWKENGMLYLYGNIGSGHGEVYLMAVEEGNLLKRDAYSFYAGMDERGNPRWSLNEDDAVIVVDHNERELGITYNAYLSRYLLTGMDCYNNQVVVQESSTLYGPWSDASTLIQSAYTPHHSSCYGAYTLPDMVENGGQSMYFTLTEWNPYQVLWMRVDFAKKEN